MIRILSIALFTLTSTFAFAAPEKANIDPKNSIVKWAGSKIFVKTLHKGTVVVSGGFLNIDDGKVVGGEIIVDMTTIKDQDLADPGMQAKLVGHLNSADFFDTAHFKEAKFVITKATLVKKGPDSDYVFDGNLTIHGKTNPATINAKVSSQGKMWIAFGDFKFDRTLFDVKYNSKGAFPDLIKSGKDKIIADEVDLAFTVKTDGK
jgi:polyisoprenoid-binding protein YceI